MKLGDRVRIPAARHRCGGNSLYPPGTEFTVTGFAQQDGHDRIGALCAPFAGYPHGVERWDFVDRWELI